MWQEMQDDSTGCSSRSPRLDRKGANIGRTNQGCPSHRGTYHQDTLAFSLSSNNSIVAVLVCVITQKTRNKGSHHG